MKRNTGREWTDGHAAAERGFAWAWLPSPRLELNRIDKGRVLRVRTTEVLQLWTEQLYVALPSKHLLARRKQVPWSAQFILRKSERGPILCDTVLQKLSSP